MPNPTGMRIALYLNEISHTLHVAIPSLLRIAGVVLSLALTKVVIIINTRAKQFVFYLLESKLVIA